MSEVPTALLIAPLCLFSIFVGILILTLATAVKVVPEYRRLSVFRLGRYIGEKGPGLVILLPFIDSATPVDAHDPLKKAQEQQRLWGAIGETKTLVHTEGTVEISGETWNPVSKEPIPPGARVRIARVVLEVEKL